MSESEKNTSYRPSWWRNVILVVVLVMGNTWIMSASIAYNFCSKETILYAIYGFLITWFLYVLVGVYTSWKIGRGEMSEERALKLEVWWWLGCSVINGIANLGWLFIAYNCFAAGMMYWLEKGRISGSASDVVVSKERAHASAENGNPLAVALWIWLGTSIGVYYKILPDLPLYQERLKMPNLDGPSLCLGGWGLAILLYGTIGAFYMKRWSFFGMAVAAVAVSGILYVIPGLSLWLYVFQPIGLGYMGWRAKQINAKKRAEAKLVSNSIEK